MSTGDSLLLLARALYWSMPVVLALWGWALVVRWRSERWSWSALVRRHGGGLLVALAATATCLLLVPPTMRVQFDETSLVSVSQNMHEQRAALLTTGAVPFDGGLMRLENSVDKRPPLFAFLVSVVHDASGMRIANAFAVNAALLAVLLWLAYAFARRWLGPTVSLAAPLLVVAMPLIKIVATSAGFELLAVVLLFVAVIAAFDVVERPEPPRVLWFFASGLLFAQARYESLVVFAVLASVVVWRVRGRLRLDRRCVVLFALTPVMLAPLAFLLEHSRNPNFYPEANGQPLLSVAHLRDHLWPFVCDLFGGGNGLWVGLSLGVGLAGYVAWRLHHRPGAVLDLLVCLPVLAATVITLAWFHGDATEPTARRLFLPAVVTSALLPLMWCRVLHVKVMDGLVPCYLLVVAFGSLGGRPEPSLEATKLTNAIDGALAQFGTSKGDTLWLTVAAQHLIVKGYAALSPEAFVRRSARPAGQASTIDELRARGDIKRLMLVETPYDDAFAPAFGSVKELLAAIPTEVVGRFDTGMPVVVHRAR